MLGFLLIVYLLFGAGLAAGVRATDPLLPHWQAIVTLLAWPFVLGLTLTLEQ